MTAEELVAVCWLAGTVVGTIGGIVVSSRVTTGRIEQLVKKMDKHNGLVERIVVVERDQETLFRYHDEQ